jgi:hypothetical protein
MLRGFEKLLVLYLRRLAAYRIAISESGEADVMFPGEMAIVPLSMPRRAGYSISISTKDCGKPVLKWARNGRLCLRIFCVPG